MKTEVMKRLCIVILCFAFFSAIPGRIQADDDLTLTNLRTDYKTNPLGIDERNPRLSWEIISSKRGTRQTACELHFAQSEKKLMQGSDLIWQKKVNSDQSVQVVYLGPLLHSRQRIYWRARIWDNHGRVSQWSKPAYWEMGLLNESDWQADWIEADIKEELHL